MNYIPLCFKQIEQSKKLVKMLPIKSPHDIAGSSQIHKEEKDLRTKMTAKTLRRYKLKISTEKRVFRLDSLPDLKFRFSKFDEIKIDNSYSY